MKITDKIKLFGAYIADRLKPVPLTQEFEASGYYYGGGRGSMSGGAGWPGGLSGDGGGLILDHRRIRQNARVAMQDVPQAAAVVNRFADTVADIGLMLEPAPKAEILGISPEKAEEWARDVEERFDSWARSKKAYRSESMNFYQAQRLNAIMQQRDNDIFTQLFYSSDRELQNPLQIQFIDADQIRGDSFTSSWSGGINRDGIERDGAGREKAYKIWIKTSDFKYENKTIQRIGPKSKKIFMLHQYALDYAGQGRGYSRLAGSLQSFQNLTDFSLSQIKKAINQSSITMYVKPSQDNPASNIFEDAMNAGGAGIPASVAQFGSNPTPATSADGITAEATLPLNYCPMPEVTIDTPGSVGVFNLNEGEDLRPFDGKGQSESYDKFVDAFTSYLSASMGMPLEVLLMKFNQNYSASRAALILFWRVAEIWREEMNTDFNNPIFEMWLGGEIAAGRISAPGWSDPVLKAAWLNCRWIGSPMPNIDPAKTAKSDREYAEMGATTLDRISRNLNGSSGKANRAKIAKEFAEIPQSPWNIGSGQVEDDEGKDDDEKGGNNG